LFSILISGETSDSATDTDLIFFFYSIQRKFSFEKVKQIIDLSMKTEKALFPVLIGTHADIEMRDRNVSTNEGLKLAEEIGAVFGEVSNKTGEGIPYLLNKIEMRLAQRIIIEDDDNNIIILNSNDVQPLTVNTNSSGNCCK
jgi:hypothetical protein